MKSENVGRLYLHDEKSTTSDDEAILQLGIWATEDGYCLNARKDESQLEGSERGRV